MKFRELNLDERIQQSLERLKYENLTPIQEQIIPAIQRGQDVIGCSQTGSGKTGAFLIPIMVKLLENKDNKALIVTPTRELATQIIANIKDLYDGNSIDKSLIIGGASIKGQLLSIRKNPRLIVGTPGRLNDFIDSKKLDLSKFNILVLDEMDRMLDMGFSAQIQSVVEQLDKNRQTMLFSATVSKKIEKMSQQYLKEPFIAKLGELNQPSVNVSQEIIKITSEEKLEKLVTLIRTSTTFSIVFVRTKRGAEKLASKIFEAGFESRAIHGDFKQSKRERIIRDFRSKRFNVLVATDVVARGIDIPHIDTVFNYDLPQSPEDYIHRIGRCSRGLDIKGRSVSFCNRDDEDRLEAIQSLISTGDYEDVAREKNKKKFGNRTRGYTANKDNSEGRDKFKEKSKFKSKNNRDGKKSFNKDGKKFTRKSEDGQRSEGGNKFTRKSEDGNRFSQRSEGGNKFSRKSEGGNKFSQKSEGGNKFSRKSEKSGSGYDIDGLISKRNSRNIKRQSPYMISNNSNKKRKDLMDL